MRISNKKRDVVYAAVYQLGTPIVLLSEIELVSLVSFVSNVSWTLCLTAGLPILMS